VKNQLGGLLSIHLHVYIVNAYIIRHHHDMLRPKLFKETVITDIAQIRHTTRNNLIHCWIMENMTVCCVW